MIYDVGLDFNVCSMKKKDLTLLLFFCISVQFSFSQNPCAFDEQLAKKKFPAHPRINKLQADQFQQVVTIPVVVHVVWHDPSENISDAQIFSQLDVLNEDFRKQNADTGLVRPLFRPLAADAQIEFCLAQRDPQGNVSNGITRTYSTVPDWGCNDSMKFSSAGGADGWPGADYLNIWVCKLNCANGYAYYPGTPDPYDGVVVHYYVFGRTGNVAPGYHGRTGDHEVGHYFGLYHTFDYTGLCEGSDTSNCSTEGDYVCDTPADINPDFGCPAFVNDCADTPIDNPDQTENFMDYGDDDCRVMFSLGQVDRMRGYIFSDRLSLLTSLGCVPPTGIYFDAGILALEKPSEEICAGTTTPVIRISNTSNAMLTTLTVDFEIDSSGVTSIAWTGNIAAGTSDTISLLPVTLAAGMHTLQVTLSNPNGQVDQNPVNNIAAFPIEVISTGLPIPFAEGFESSGFPYQHWSTEDPDNTYGWEQTFLAGANSNASMRTRNFYNQGWGTLDGLLTPKYNLTGYPSAALSFDVAYSDPNNNYYSDTLRLLYSLDCGLTWTVFWQDGGTSLSTAPYPLVFSEFVPDSSQWENHIEPLNQFLGAPMLSLKFESKNGFGNDMYIDNINLSIPTSVNISAREEIEIYPNPAETFLEIKNIHFCQSITVLNMIGEKIILPMKISQAQIDLDVHTLSPGIYMLQAITSDEQLTKMFIEK
jgi:hypothetical protein